MNKRTFIKTSGLGALGFSLLPSALKAKGQEVKLRTAHIGVGNMGFEDLRDVASHPQVQVTALCDVDA
ncbi:MAG: gfo/Idh/MocA family oxidoreductase, partial [Eudoraea sp.]|nr:gfo/Idh/MocA family oxidoreductase [Eudoraea sp.]